MQDVTVIDDPAAAEASLDPIRSEPACSPSWPSPGPQARSRRPRAHPPEGELPLRALERHRLVELVEERRKGNCTERVLLATAASHVISPTALSAVAGSAT